jgi:putative ABC transport system permease protein
MTRPKPPRFLILCVRNPASNPLRWVSFLSKEACFLAQLLYFFAVLATILSAAGVYGLISYTTQRSTHEFGVRIALGAQSHDVLWMVLRRGLLLAVAGLLIGFGAAIWMTRLLTSFLFGVSLTDPITFAGVALLIAAVAVVASYLPARSASRVDPMVVLRHE